MTDDPSEIPSGDRNRVSPCPAIKIRSAIPADIPAVLAVEVQSLSASHWSANEYERILARELLLVAEIEGQVVGFISGKHARDEWELENLAVAPAFRHRQIGKQLLDGLIAHVRQCSGSTVFLEVRDSNLSARRFYEKHGFVEVGRRRRYYHEPDEDAVLYKVLVTSCE